MERLWFEPAVEGLFLHTLNGQISPPLAAKLKRIGIDLGEKLKPAYPAPVWAEAISITGAELRPELDPDARCDWMGELFSSGYASTFSGKAMYALLKILGPRRTLLRVERNFRSVTNYVSVQVDEILPDRYALTFNHVDGIPYFFKGIIDHSGKELGAPRKSSDTVVTDGSRLTLFIDIRPTVDSPFPRREDLNRQPSPNAQEVRL